MSFYCEICNFSTLLKANYNRHLETKKHLKNNEKVRLKLGFVRKKLGFSNKEYVCKYCNKTYKHNSTLSNHIKYKCEKNKEEDLKELVRLMNLQLEKKNKQLQQKDKQIEKLMNKLQVNNITNIVQNNNIQLLSYQNTDISFLTDNDYISCLKKVTLCVKHLIEKIHFNPTKPENMNIYISNMRDKYIMLYDGIKWVLKNKEKEIESLYENKEILLEEWLQENKNNKTMKEKFIKYLNNKEKDENMNIIKEEIKLMMYNNKQISHRQS